MKQTEIMLVAAQADYSDALNVLTLVEMGVLPVTIEEAMIAYMVAKKWTEWIVEPEMSDSPLRGRKNDLSSCLEMFQNHVEFFETSIVMKSWEVKAVFENINPNLISLLRSPVAGVKEMTTIYFQALRVTAKLFSEKQRDLSFEKLLDSKNVPLA